MPNDEQPDLAVDTGAEFEENQPSSSHKLVINDRPRVTAPERQAATRSKATVVKPDATKQELKPSADTADSVATSDQAAVDELAKQAVDKKNQQTTADSSAEQKHAQDLIDAKTYFVPIGQVSKRRHTLVGIVVVLLLVAAGAVAFLLFS